ncbi:MAG: PDZ domain-containing protein [Chloroflexi bacterium]|nr:PDZ domain-containing protein [Chloroflexota bacterium]
MKRMTGIFIRILVLLALLVTSALAYAQDEKETESAAAPFIGIRYWYHDDGLFVTGIIPNTPAAEVGLQAGDIVEAVNGEAIRVETVRDVVWKHDAGATVALSIDRDGRAFDLDLTLMARPADLFENPDYALPLDLAAVGLYVGQCNDMLIVIGALAGSDIAAAGFQVYDQIIEIDGEAVNTIGEADAAVSGVNEGDELSFRLLRAERELVIKVIAEDHRRRDPRHRPPRRPHPRLEVERAYVSENIELGYGDGFVVVSELKPAHDLYAAGLRQFDLIVEANGAPVEEAVDLFRDGDTIEVAIERVNSTLHFDIPVSAAPLLMIGDAEPVEQDRSQWLGLHEKQVTLGVRYIQLEPDSPHFEGSEVREGALVAEVIEGLPAAKAGVQEDDIIVAVAGEPVTLEIDLRNRIYFHEPGERVRLDILRAGEVIQIEVTLRVASK